MFYVVPSSIGDSNFGVLEQFCNCSSFWPEESEGGPFLFWFIVPFRVSVFVV
jgi:hypothetical protein